MPLQKFGVGVYGHEGKGPDNSVHTLVPFQ